MGNEPSVIEVLTERVTDMLEGVREELGAALDEEFDWSLGAAHASRLAGLLRVRAMLDEYDA